MVPYQKSKHVDKNNTIADHSHKLLSLRKTKLQP